MSLLEPYHLASRSTFRWKILPLLFTIRVKRELFIIFLGGVHKWRHAILDIFWLHSSHRTLFICKVFCTAFTKSLTPFSQWPWRLQTSFYLHLLRGNNLFSYTFVNTCKWFLVFRTFWRQTFPRRTSPEFSFSIRTPKATSTTSPESSPRPRKMA